MPDPDSQPRVLRRVVGGLEADASRPCRLIACVATGDERRRFIFGAGTDPALIRRQPELGAAVVENAQSFGGALIVTTHGDGPLAMADGSLLSAPVTLAEPELLRGCNSLMGFRLGEPAEAVAEGLAYHHRTFGLRGALIIDRAEAPDPKFDKALARALGQTGLTVVMVSFALPLGRKDQGAMNDLALAPAAPGKAKLDPPAPDPWRAPLAEPLPFEVVRWAFLSEARAVLALDVCDILLPDSPNPFDVCCATPGGLIRLEGTLAYPWRVRPGAAARFGDHVCRQFDARNGATRWGVAPRRAGQGGVWRLVRIADRAGASPPVVPFFRAMSLRIPGVASARLVPKAALVEDPRLLALAGALGHDPVRPPASLLRDLPEKPPSDRNTVIVGAMKNEGPFLLEWIAFHRSIGVTGFLIYTNDCTDGTDTFLQLLQDKGLCQHRRNPWRPGDAKSPHPTALDIAMDEPLAQAADWLISMDVDEFINIKLGDGTLAALYEAAGEANMISLPWRLFGNGDIVGYEDRPIIEQFNRCAPEYVRNPYQAWGFKTLFRNIEIFRKIGIHRPKGLKPEHADRIHWLTGSGKRMPDSMFRNGWRMTKSTYGYDWAQLNHYAVRSVESFLVKRDRGRANHATRDLGRAYWFRMCHNGDSDMSIRRLVPRFRAEYDRLLSDPDIRAAHALSVARHRDKIVELMARPDQQTFHAELSGERMQRLCRLQHVFGSAVFAAGPQVVPDDIVFNDALPTGFFFTVAEEEQSHE